MLKLFAFISGKETLQQRKEAYKEVFLNNLAQFKFDITQPLLDMSEYQDAVQSYFSARLVSLEEGLEHHSLVRRFKDQYAEKIIGLTQRLTTLSELAEKQQIGSEAALVGYQKKLNVGLLDIKKIAEEFFQQVNKDITELLGLLSTVAFKQSDPLLHITDQIRDAIRRDLTNIQSEAWALAPDEHLFKTLSVLVDSEALSQVTREQLLGLFEKLNSSKNAKLMIFSLNAAFNTVPSRLSEIGCENASITARIQGLGRFLDEKSVGPLEHYLMTAQDYFSLLLRLDRDDPGLVNYIEAHSTEKPLFERLLEKFKKNELVSLRILKQAFRTVLDSEVKNLEETNRELGDSSEPLNNLIDEYNGRLRALELTFEVSINDYHKLSSFYEVSNYYCTVLEMIKLHSVEVRKKAAEYRLVALILEKSRCVDKAEIDIFFKEIKDPDCRKKLVKSITEKAFHLLGKVPSSKFGVYIENLLQFAEAEEVPLASSESPDYLFLLKKELRDSLRGRHLAYFIKQQSEKIGEYLHNKRGGRDCGPFSLLNRYLNYCDLSQLEALAKNKPNLEDTIKRVISTKQLLDFQSKYHAGLLWEICEWFHSVDTYQRPLPFFTTPQDRDCFFSTMDAISFLRNAIENINGEKSNYKASFFVLNSDVKVKKREALERLKEQLKTLPNLIDNQVLDEKIKNWETEFGAVIDKQRYRFYLILGVMIYQALKYYILGQTTVTESRHCVERLKQYLYQASAAMQANAQEGPANTSALRIGLSP
ncbi:hypothetical protein [Rickettsiella endosymbiont of Dermanyssus gallinae]|uniref:hypothetical protein n=1 Tax=Rickettsiella endosymbiont of Dermanyssus gallinae TaxID=2856608 RepID=UPI001C52E1C1|nr:hypothetical protein [Rickettsiella endosymbiont of Dermanyssus gallinae]